MTVAGDVTPLITTTSPTLSSVVERARIEELPLNAGKSLNLLEVTRGSNREFPETEVLKPSASGTGSYSSCRMVCRSATPTSPISPTGRREWTPFRSTAKARNSTTNLAPQLGVPNPFGIAGAPNLSNVGFAITGEGVIPCFDDTKPVTAEQNYTRVWGKHQMGFG